MKRISIITTLLAASLVSSAAFATNNGNDKGQATATASTGPVSNSNTNVVAPVAHGGQATAINGPNTNLNNATANGGAGGQGGRGGDGGSVLGSGNSSSSSGVIGSGNSSNNNANVQGQMQGQAQQATGGTSSAGASAGATSNSGGNQMTQVGGAQTSTQANSVTVTGDTVTYAAQERNPVSTAYAAALSSANGTCMGSSSGGAQGASFGISFGSTWVDAGCDARYDATALSAAGQPRAAIARLCLKPEIAQAMKDAGTPCPGAKVAVVAPVAAPAAAPAPAVVAPRAAPTPAAQPTPAARQPRQDRGSIAGNDAYAANQRGESVDPIVRARLGLPPLK